MPIRIGRATGTRLTVTHTRAGAHLQVTAMKSATATGDWPTILARLAAWVSTQPVIGHAVDVGPRPGAAWYGDRYPGWVSRRILSGAER
jgi:hypothetical protein